MQICSLKFSLFFFWHAIVHVISKYWQKGQDFKFQNSHLPTNNETKGHAKCSFFLHYSTYSLITLENVKGIVRYTTFYLG